VTQTFVNVFARIEAGLLARMHRFAAREGKLLRVMVAEALESFESLAKDDQAVRSAIRAYTSLESKSGKRLGVALQLMEAQKAKVSQLARRLKIKKQILYGAALLNHVRSAKSAGKTPKKRKN